MNKQDEEIRAFIKAALENGIECGSSAYMQKSKDIDICVHPAVWAAFDIDRRDDVDKTYMGGVRIDLDGVSYDVFPAMSGEDFKAVGLTVAAMKAIHKHDHKVLGFNRDRWHMFEVIRSVAKRWY